MSALKIVIGCAVVAASFEVGAWLGFDKARHKAVLAEAKVLHAVLTEIKRRDNADAVCRQYVLARYYRSLAKLNGAERAGLVVDFGPVNRPLLLGVPIDKDPFDPDEVYSQAVRPQ